MYGIQQVCAICEAFGWRCVQIDDSAASIFVFDNYGAEYNIMMDDFSEHVRFSMTMIEEVSAEREALAIRTVHHANNLISAGVFLYFDGEVRVACDVLCVSEEAIEHVVNILIAHYNNFKACFDETICGEMAVEMMEYMVSNASGVA